MKAKVKRVLCLPMLAVLCIALVGCSLSSAAENIFSYGRELFGDPRKNDIRFHASEFFVRDEIFRIIEERDTDALVALFSNELRSEVPGFEEKAEEYLSFIKGNYTGYTNQSGSSSGLPTYRFDYWYIISTDEDEYVIYYEFYSRDNAFEEENREDVSDKLGIHQMVILRKELADEIRGNPWPHSDGIFIMYSMDDYPLP